MFLSYCNALHHQELLLISGYYKNPVLSVNRPIILIDSSTPVLLIFRTKLYSCNNDNEYMDGKSYSVITDIYVAIID